MAGTEHETGAPAPTTASLSEPRRRAWLIGGVAALAAAAGAGVAVWRLRPAGLAPAAADAAVQALWQLKLQAPDGQPLALDKLQGKPLLVNFWATWCPPCVEEMPLLDAFFRENSAKGLNVLGLAIDQAPAVQRFLARAPVAFPVAMGGLEGSELGRSLGNTTGGLPFSVLLGADGSIRQRKMGQLTPEILAQWKASAGV